ncbi:hypothetical protein NliqN6_6464 [Naganishia liquefaciens]|uniref:Uncharacterized protein n=1 Tax=Naganishia liquefaciens TaxID=104408 RepID=A0A8H3TZQ6_9TREE|nr:hypothetical protein NliqN6_6464 [Naganishia liquefaciens]
MAPAYIQRASLAHPMAVRQEHEILTLDDEVVLDTIDADLNKVTPAATKAAYGPAQREFREWCLIRAVKEGKPTRGNHRSGAKSNGRCEAVSVE